MTWGRTDKRAARDPHAGLIIVLTVITTLGIAAKLVAPAQHTIAKAPQSEPSRSAWFSLSFEDIAE